MSQKFINWIDRKGVPIMTFVVVCLLAVMALAVIYRLIFTTQL